MLLPVNPSVVKLFEIIYEDSELLIINKPAGLVCHPTKTDECSSLISRARLHLGPDSRPHLVNRLDRETSGVTIAAKDLETARELRRIWENRQVEKDYLAIMHGLPRLAACGIVLSA
ncbi:MAG: pseudouridine synthase [Verrucomicrobiota bacterium]